MNLRRLAMISVHTSPLAAFGRKKTGGMNVYIRELAQELARRGIEVDIFTRRSSEDEPEVDERLGPGVRVVYLTAGGLRPLGPDELYPHLSEFTAKLIAFATMRSLHYDMVYSHYWLSGWVAQKLKEAWNIPFVQMFHTLGQMKRRLQTIDSLLPDQRINTEMQVVEWADRIIAATPAEHAQLLWLYRAKRRKIEIVPPGVNTTRFVPLSQEEAKARLGFETCHVLLFVGRLEPLKAVDSVLNALSHIRNSAPHVLDNLCFVVVGGDLEVDDDAEMLRLRRLTDELGLKEVVRFMGAREPHELPLFYAAASAVVMPSDYESFGMVALEAMASGRPVIASRVGGLAFVVRDAETGYTVPVRDSQALAEKIVMLLNDASQRQAMGLRASQLALEYAWPNIADRLLAVFDDVQSQRLSRRKH